MLNLFFKYESLSLRSTDIFSSKEGVTKRLGVYSSIIILGSLSSLKGDSTFNNSSTTCFCKVASFDISPKLI